MLFFMVFIMPVLLEGAVVDILFLNILFLTLYFIGIFSSEDKWNIYVSSFLFLAHLILLMIRFDDTPKEYYLLERLVGLVNMSLFIFINVRLLFRNAERNIFRVIGAVNVYLLFALMGAFAFEILKIQTGKSIAGNISLQNNDTDYAAYIYYSLVSLTTVGYGDIYPDGMASRMLSVLLSAVGILYPAVVIARLVTNNIVSNKEL
ncbi:two pore domain potassium channel family protein [Pedobacter hiemivivus]|uniref:Two pore domain potassium channel family protein n=2 Tax=Pedobacter hiemivivus TaxID=2530454 RepID=A0A4V5PCZ1_9SPHI|nr:two pore domain potassium channel family protein [Pedobacter hiemivivus]TKC62606.1 two pore domain potassium channel family protein [Pedobacter hiemivivus]